MEIVNYVGVDDVGRAVNPLILHGQAHGAITQGLGQALSEICAYDPNSGQLLAGSFMDYAMPRAHALPRYETIISEIPATTNPLGIRAGPGVAPVHPLGFNMQPNFVDTTAGGRLEFPKYIFFRNSEK